MASAPPSLDRRRWLTRRHNGHQRIGKPGRPNFFDRPTDSLPAMSSSPVPPLRESPTPTSLACMDAAPLLSLSSGQHHFVVNLIEMGGVEFVAIELKGRLASSTLRQFGERVLIVPGHQDGAPTEGQSIQRSREGDWSTSNDFVETTTSHDIDRFPVFS